MPPAPAQVSALDDALKALKGLQSVVSGGVSYRDYAPRVTDAKIIVDRYLGQPERGDAAQRATIAGAMRFYVLAVSGWNAWVSNPGGYALAVDDAWAREECPAVKHAVAADIMKMFSLPRGAAGLRFEGPPAFWSCAADRIVEAERVISR